MKPQKCLWVAMFSALVLSSVSGSTLYVNLNSTNPVPPYSAWSTAATNIQDAIDAASVGDQILVNDGVYDTGGETATNSAVTNRVVVNKAVTVQSVNGPNVTVIDGGVVMPGDDGVRCVYLASGATLNGFTLEYGSANIVSDPKRPEGGGVWCESITATVSNCVITGNVAEFWIVTNSGMYVYGSGGGAYGGTLVNCTLTDNSGVLGGGAAYSRLNNCTLSNNRDEQRGGGAYDCTLFNCSLTGNAGYGTGGGAYGCTLNDCLLDINSASWEDGGGAADCTLYNCVLTRNYADTGGGVSDCTLNNCTLENNSTDGGGGGASYSTLNNCILTNNGAEGGGGAYESILNDCTVTDNSGYAWGGGAFFCTLNNCLVTSNSTGFTGGGASECTLYGCTLTGNSAYSDDSDFPGEGGGAIECTLYNCTLTGNSADVVGGAYSSTLYNCILFYNSDTNTGNYDASSTLNYCCTIPLPPSGVGNIDADPLFVDTNGWSDLRLQPSSPCINAGDNDYVSTTTDLDGYPRIVGGTVDMGAYEFWTPALLVERLIGLVNESGFTASSNRCWRPWKRRWRHSSGAMPSRRPISWLPSRTR